MFAASGSEGLQVLFSGTGFLCCQGSPLFLTGYCHLLGVGVKPVSSLVGLPTENGEGSIVEVFPSITCVTIVRTWKRFLKRTCKFLDFTLLTGFAHVKGRPPLLFLCDTVTLMTILLCCTPKRDSYRIQHSGNWCLVRIRSNWCRCLDLT